MNVVSIDIPTKRSRLLKYLWKYEIGNGLCKSYVFIRLDNIEVKVIVRILMSPSQKVMYPSGLNE
jgi:hypothetical protein